MDNQSKSQQTQYSSSSPQKINPRGFQPPQLHSASKFAEQMKAKFNVKIYDPETLTQNPNIQQPRIKPSQSYHEDESIKEARSFINDKIQELLTEIERLTLDLDIGKYKILYRFFSGTKDGLLSIEERNQEAVDKYEEDREKEEKLLKEINDLREREEEGLKFLKEEEETKEDVAGKDLEKENQLKIGFEKKKSTRKKNLDPDSNFSIENFWSEMEGSSQKISKKHEQILEIRKEMSKLCTSARNKFQYSEIKNEPVDIQPFSEVFEYAQMKRENYLKETTLSAEQEAANIRTASLHSQGNKTNSFLVSGTTDLNKLLMATLGAVIGESGDDNLAKNVIDKSPKIGIFLIPQKFLEPAFVKRGDISIPGLEAERLFNIHKGGRMERYLFKLENNPFQGVFAKKREEILTLKDNSK